MGKLLDFGRILIAALTALIVVFALRPWAMSLGLGLKTSWDVWALRLMSYWDVWAVTYLELTSFLIILLSAEQTLSVGLRSANTTPPADFHTALGNPTDVAGSVSG